MKTKMRIVAIIPGKDVFIQKYISGEWKQKIVSVKCFSEMMETEYPEHWKEYKSSNSEKSPENFFWNYGCSEKMIAKGESFIFE